jgi:hypothetical protein
MADANVIEQIDAAWGLSEADLCKCLVTLSTTPNPVATMKDLVALADTQHPEGFLKIDWIASSAPYFEAAWKGLRKNVCQIYQAHIPIGDSQDLAKYIAHALLATASVSNPLMAVIVTLAVTRGLDKLCPIPPVNG